MTEFEHTNPLTRDNTFSLRTESALRDMILDGRLAPGQRLNEVKIAASLGISRGPLREAIQRLSTEGLLTVISHRGAFVRTFERSEVVELYELRSALELHAVRLVCARASEEDLADLEAMLDETQSRMTKKSKRAYPKELDFHLRLVSLAKNQALMHLAVKAHTQISLARSISAKRPMRARAAVLEHVDLVKALRARDAERATLLMSEHLERSMASALSILGLPNDQDEIDEE